MARHSFAALSLLALLLSTPVTASATPVTFTGTLGSLQATAKFDTVGTDLIVTLTNTSLSDVLVPADILTAVLFTLAGDPTLTPVSAVLAGGSSVFFDAPPVGGVVGGEWAYGDGLAGAPGGADEGISSAGFGLFGGANFPGPNLDGPGGVNGLQYGITSAGDNTASGNAPVTGGFPLIKNSVIFTLSGLPPGFDPSTPGAISNVSFQYGTALNEPNIGTGNISSIGNIPEPGSLLLVGVGLGLAIKRLRQS